MASKTTQGVQHAIVALDALSPHPRNYRQHPEQQVARLGASLARFGQVRSIVVQEGADGRYLLVAGHGLAQAARANGYTELRADVIPPTWTDAQVEGYLIADNETTRGADDDLVALAQMLEEQQHGGYDLEALGYSDEELAALLDDLANAALADGDQHEVDDPDGGGDDFDTTPEESGPTRCQPGDLWVLGSHRLLCGDSTRAEDVARLMAGETAQALITDPPYGMRLDTDFSGMKNRLGFAQDKNLTHGHKYAPVMGDDEDFDAAPVATLYDAPEQFWFGADYYSSTLDDTMHTGAWLVWDKRLEESADKMFGSCFELIWSRKKHKRNILRHKWAGIFGTEKEPQRGRQHPTQKPLVLLADIVEQYTELGALVTDAFLGSGTTLVACERTGRRCYGMELSPRYCDVILRRWESETGREATLLERLSAPEEAASGQA